MLRQCLLFCILIMLPTILVSQPMSSTSRLEVYSLETGEREIIREEEDHFEAPNWSKDGSYFIINQNGLLYKISMDGNLKEHIATGFAKDCNNDHGISPDGKSLVISNNDLVDGVTSGTSRIYVLPINGGEPRLVTQKMPSYWHGWSPDGKHLIYTALRNNDYDIYRISVKGGEETRLTNAPGLDDGPEYSPDGNYIYYNSFQSGSMELWRMKNDGSNKEQLTYDSYSNWFPHPSPDGNYLVFLSYLKDQQQNHPPLKKVALRLLNLKDNSIKTLCTFIGGQGTINVPSWSPDSKKFAFVSYKTKS